MLEQGISGWSHWEAYFSRNYVSNNVKVRVASEHHTGWLPPVGGSSQAWAKNHLA